MLQIIIAISVFIIVTVIKTKNAKQNPATTQSGGENFPFPKPENGSPFDEWLGRTFTNPDVPPAGEYEPVQQKVEHVKYKSVEDIEFSKGGTYVPVESELKIVKSKKAKTTSEAFVFNAQDAIIYSEIMKPKFDL